MESNYVVAENVAIEDVIKFAEYHADKAFDIDQVKESYPDVIEAVRLGLLTFDDDQVPTLKLKRPVKNKAGEVTLDSIVFKTRLPVSEQERLAKGIDIKNEQMKLVNKYRAYFIKQPVAMLDEIGKFDFRVIDQVSSVF